MSLTVEKDLNLVQKLSLEEVTLRRVVANWWIETDTLPEFQELPFKWYSEDEGEGKWRELSKGRNKNNGEWLNAVEKIKDKVSKLVIPESLKKRMMHIIKPIGIDISGWKTFHEIFLCSSRDHFDVRILEQLCWTSAGKIDFQKTAERLVRFETLDMLKRYKLSCLYCLEDYASGLWQELPEEYLSRFNDEIGPYLVKVIPLEFYWAYLLKGEESKLDYILQSPLSFRLYAFQFSARKGNKAATEYFFQKLSNEEQDSFLFDTASIVVEKRRRSSCRMRWDFPKEKFSDVLCYLLSEMTPDQQMRVLKQHPCGVLKCFLDWSWQDLFLDIADIVWTFLPVSNYGHLQWEMIETFRNSDYYFPNLFQEFFLRSPRDFRKHFISRECRFGSFFSEFFNVEDTETIELVFRNIDAEDRGRFVSCYWFFKYFDCFATGKKLHLAKLCLREATLSKEDRVKLKEIFKIFLPETGTIGEILREKKLECFLDSFDETDTSAINKRNSEDETPTKAKKPCSGEERNVLPDTSLETGLVLALKEVNNFTRMFCGNDESDYYD